MRESVARRAGPALAVSALFLLSACSVNPLSRRYEYEEEIYVNLDGSATVYVNAAVPALVALRGVDLPLDASARLDRNDVRAIFETAGQRACANVSTSRRDGPTLRPRARRGPRHPPPERGGDHSPGPLRALRRQRRGRVHAAVGACGRAGRRATSAGPASELVAFRLHLPSRVTFPQFPLEASPAWQHHRLGAAARGAPRGHAASTSTSQMDSDSILASTLLLFGAMIVLVVIAFSVFIWFIGGREQGPNRRPRAA